MSRTKSVRLILIPIMIGLAATAGALIAKEITISPTYLCIGTTFVLLFLFTRALPGDHEQPTTFPEPEKEINGQVYNVEGGQSQIIEVEGTKWMISPYSRDGEWISAHRISPRGRFVGKPVIGRQSEIGNYIKRKVTQ